MSQEDAMGDESVATTLRAYSIMVLAVFGVVVNLACIGILLRRRRNAIFHNLLKVCYLYFSWIPNTELD